MTSKTEISPLNFHRIFSETAITSWAFFRDNTLVRDITIIDFIMQLASFRLWNFYLAYTSVRCLVLLSKYIMVHYERSAEKKIIWKQAQLYSSTKAIGILASQTALIIIGFSSVKWGACVYAWGGFLACLSCYACHRSK